MEEKDDIKKELENTAPFISGMKKSEPFSAPDGYFDRFHAGLQDKIRDRGQQAGVALGWRQLSSALAVIFLGILTAVLMINDKDIPSKNLAEAPARETISSYDMMLEELDEHTIVASYEAQIALAGNENIEEYVLENIDENILMEEL